MITLPVEELAGIISEDNCCAHCVYGTDGGCDILIDDTIDCKDGITKWLKEKYRVGDIKDDHTRLL